MIENQFPNLPLLPKLIYKCHRLMTSFIKAYVNWFFKVERKIIPLAARFR